MIRLYGYWRSSATWRVRIGLNLKGVAYETVPVHLVRGGGEQHAPDHKARNPSEQVPVLEITRDGAPQYLTQSLAILRWLDAVYPEPPLLPSEPLQAAIAWQLAEVVNSGIQPLQNLHLLQTLQASGADSQAWARDAIARGLTALESLAAPVAGRYLVGDQVTIADLCLVPQLFNARRFGVDLAPMPTLLRVESACAAHPAFAASIPARQIDAVET